MQSKMVDYAIYLRSGPLMERIRRVLQELPKSSQSINQTMHGPLREQPIGINFETKPPFTGGDTADVQIAIWSGAGLLRLRQLLQQNRRGEERVPTMPALSFHGHDLNLSGIQEREDHNVYPLNSPVLDTFG